MAYGETYTAQEAQTTAGNFYPQNLSAAVIQDWSEFAPYYNPDGDEETSAQRDLAEILSGSRNFMFSEIF